jgi:hypothetical protein
MNEAGEKKRGESITKDEEQEENGLAAYLYKKHIQRRRSNRVPCTVLLLFITRARVARLRLRHLFRPGGW